MKTLVKNVIVLTMNEKMDTYDNGYLIFEDDTILEVGSGTPENFSGEIIDGKRAILMPGMINTHTHAGMIPFRSLGDDCPDRLRRFLFPLENACMTSKLASLSTEYAIAEMLLGGVTCLADMYYFEDQLVDVVQKTGMRALLGETLIDFKTCDTKEAFGGFDIIETMAKMPQKALVTPMLAPHATNTVSKEVLEKVDALSLKYHLPWMMHISEMDYEMQLFKDQYQMTPVEYLESIGVLSNRLIMAHGIHLTKHDIQLMKQYGVTLAHCIGSNTKAGKGVAPIQALLKAGVNVGLGTDGPSSGNTLDLFVQMRLFASFHKTWLKDRAAFPSPEIVKLATIKGAKTLHLEDKIGSLEKGKQADFILVETDSVNMFPIHDPYAAIVYSANASNVKDVYVAGKQLVKDKKLCHIDLSDLKARLWQEMADFNKQAKKASQSL